MRSFALRPALLHRSRARQLPRGAAIDASAARSLAPDVPPSAPRFCVLPAAAIPRNTSSTALPDQRAPRLAPGHPYMPQGVSPVGLARSVCPQNNSIPICPVYNTVVLVEVKLEDRCLPARRPGAPPMRPLAQAAFVYEDDGAAFFLGFYLISGQRLRFHSSIKPSLRSRARPTGCCTLPFNCRRMRQTCPG